MGDLRYAARALGRNKGFTLIAVLTLGLGIGANTAIFTVVKAVLLTPLPYRDADRLVRVWESNVPQNDPRAPLPPASFAAYRDAGVFAEIGAGRDVTYNLTGGGEPEALIAYRFSAELFQVLGTRPLLGRTFLPEEDRSGHDRVAVLSYKLWQRRFGGDPGVLGRSLTLDGQGYTVVGVMPRGFQWGASLLWTPLALDPALAGDHTRRFLRVTARLKPGLDVEQAQAALGPVAARLAQDHPEGHADWTPLLQTMADHHAGDIRPALLVLGAAVGFVLLIGCANVANLLLVRMAARERDTAVRVALGASRFRLARQWLAESLLVSGLGGSLGLLLALWGLDFLIALFPPNLSNVAIPQLEALHLDAGVLSFALALSLLTGVVFGLIPALRLGGTPMGQALREGRGSVRRGRLRQALVVGEVALALVLASGAALLIRSFTRLVGGSLGFEPRGILTLRVMLPAYRPRDRTAIALKEERPNSLRAFQDDAARQRAFADEALAQLARLPGVESVGATTFLPLSGWQGTRPFTIEGDAPPAPGREPEAEFRAVAGDYFRALRTPLLAGRPFTPKDGETAPAVVLVNETFARRFFPDGRVLGRRIRMDVRVLDGAPQRPREVVGIVRDVRHLGLAEDPLPEVYVPFRQEPLRLLGFAVRAQGDPAALGTAVRQAIWAVDKDQPVSHVLTLEEMGSESVTLRRSSMLLLLFFAALGLALAALGLYGILAYEVSQRTREIGVRMALGAGQARVLRLIVGEGLRTAGFGLAAGLVASLLLTRLLSKLLFGVSPTDPEALAAAFVLLLAAALLASYLPARRATAVDPAAALRCE